MKDSMTPICEKLQFKKSVITFVTLIIMTTAFAGEFSESLLEGKVDDSLLSPQCKSELIKFYQNGQKLELKTVKATLTKFNQWTETHEQTDKKYMYHYTSHPQTIAYARTGDMSSVFQALKLRSGSLEVYGNSSGVLWTAGDPVSSKAFGNTLLRLKVDPTAKIFPYNLFNDQSFQFELNAEIEQLSASISKNCNWVNIAFFFLEDSGADIILKNYSPNYEWFTILNSISVIQVEVLSKH